jgi:hypothetical protein
MRCKFERRKQRMKAFRKWFMVFAVLSMFALLFAGCSGGGGSSSNNNGPGGGGNGPTVLNRVVSASNPVVGDWGTGVTGTDGLALTFYPNGTYIEWNTGAAGGMGVEYGTYKATPISGSTITVTVTSILDDQGDTPGDPNGASGLTEQSGQTKSIPLTIVDQNTVQVITGSGSTATLYRVVDASKPIVGSWGVGVKGDGTASDSVLLVVFYPNGTYILYGNDANATCHPGVEYGTYSYNAATSTLTVTATVDQNGDQGLANGNGTAGSATVQVNGDVITFGSGAPGTVTISGVMLDSSGPGGTEVPVAGLAIVARHPADTDNSHAIAMATSGANGSFSMTVPYGSDLYLNVSGSSGGTQYASMNTRIWRNISTTPDLSFKGEGIFAVPLSIIDSALNTFTCNGSPCSTTGMAGKGWLALDAYDAATMYNSIAGVSFLLSPSVGYFGYNDDTNGSTYQSSLSATVVGPVSMNGPMAFAYNATATMVTMTASKSGSANQTYELPIVPGEITYKQVGY